MIETTWIAVLAIVLIFGVIGLITGAGINVARAMLKSWKGF